MGIKVKHIYAKILFISGVFGTFLPLPVFAATTATSRASISVLSSCSMTATVNTAHSAAMLNGQELDGIGKTTIATNCNDPSGFAIYAVGYTNDVVGNTNLIGSNTGQVISTALGAASSNWAMKLTAVAGDFAATIDNHYDEYHVVPNQYTAVAHRDSATGVSNSQAASITTTYRAYISPTQAADVYGGAVRYVLVHPASSIASPDFDSAFASAGKDTVTASDGNDYYAMQDMTTDICNGVVDYNTETQLIDTRDEKLYWVLKAEDGKCWMTENLDLDLRTDTESVDFVALTSLNTDLNVYDDDIYNENLGYTYNESTGLITWTPSSPTYTSNAKHENGVASSTSINWLTSTIAPRSVNLTVNGKDIYQKDGSTFDSANCNYFTTPSCLNSTGDNTNTTANFSTVPYEANGEHGKIGNYYNWSAAVASNDTTTRVDNTNSAAIAENPKNSICPKGWRLTRSSSTPVYNDFQNLYSAYGNIDKANGYPLWLVRAGLVSYGTLYYSGSSGYYWSSTVYSSDYAYNLNIRSGDFYPSSYDGYARSYGFSLRCVAR